MRQFSFFSDPHIPADTRRAVNAAAARGRLPQSVMLTGGSKALREACAKELCLAVLCAEATPEDPLPCGVCHCCRKVLAGAHPDVTVVSPTGSRKTVGKADVEQQVLEPLYKSPTEADNKVYIFPDADTLSPVVQNSLLKTLEEPPEDVMFLFLCEKRESLLITVISRLTEYPLGSAPSAAGQEDDAAVTAVARGLAEALAKDNEFGLMMQTAPMAKNRAMMAKTAARLTEIVRDALVSGSGAARLSGCDREAALLAMNYGAPSLLRIKEAMDRIIADAAANANENLLLTRFSSSLAVILKERR